MAWYWWALRSIQTMEDRIVELILRRPGFHRAVGRIHRTIHDRQHGRNPNEPLYQGEATADPNSSQRHVSFLRHFRDEIRNQFRGEPTELHKEPPAKK